MQIKNIAEVIAGYTFRGAIEADTKGDVFVFQAKDLIQGEPFADEEALTRISHTGRGDAGRLQKNDIVLVARGMKSGAFRSTVFIAEAPNVIASSSVLIIRVVDPNISPEYLSLYLNSGGGQDALSQIVSGSYIGAVPRRELEKLEIPIPSLQKQAIALLLYQNLKAQEKIMDQKKIIIQNVVETIFKQLTHEKQ
jgi:restriction endonuclease S subunit